MKLYEYNEQFANLIEVDNGAVDVEKAEKEILYAYERGVNYYDTAYIYPGSEEALGTILEKNNLREKVNVLSRKVEELEK